MQQENKKNSNAEPSGSRDAGKQRKATFSSEPHVPVRSRIPIKINESDDEILKKDEDDPFGEFLQANDFVGEYKTYIYDNIVLVKVNMVRCTQKDVESFRVLLNKFIANGYQKFVVSFFKAQFLDSTFIGNMVMTFKRLLSLKGSMVLVVKKDTMLANEFERLDFNRMINVRFSFMEAINRIKEL